MSNIDGVIKRKEEQYRQQLFDILSQPSISSTGEGITECANQVSTLISEYGFEKCELIPTSGYPLVYAETTQEKSKPTVLFYGHYDVQPPGDEADWTTPPFAPTERNQSIYARGSGDNKGQFLAHVFAIDALDSAGIETSANVKLLIEGGEENGSRGLQEYLKSQPERLNDVDFVYVADGSMHQSERPTLIYGNRGLISMELRHQTAVRDLHSGSFGGPIPNAANELIELIASISKDNSVLINEFSEDVEITEADRQLARELPVSEEKIMEEYGLNYLIGDADYSERNLLEPSFTVNGIRSGYGGEGMKTIIPHEAVANIDIRLIPKQKPDKCFNIIKENINSANENISVTKLGSFPPMKTSPNIPVADLILSILDDVWQESPLEIPLLGGSLPAAYLQEKLGVPVLIVPYANSDQNNHSPDEHLNLLHFFNGIRTSSRFMMHYCGD